MFSLLDNEQLVCISVDGMRPHRAGEFRGRDPVLNVGTPFLPLSPSSLTDFTPFLFLHFTQLWSIQLSTLACLRLFNQALAEATNLFGALVAIEFLSAHLHILRHVLPFKLGVIYVRIKY